MTDPLDQSDADLPEQTAVSGDGMIGDDNIVGGSANSATQDSTVDQSNRTEVESVSSAGDLFPDLSDSASPETGNRDMSMLMEIPVQLTVELGRKRVPIKHVLQLAQGSVVELDAMAGEPMDVLVNGCLIAQGEVVVVNERFGVRLTEIVTPSERIRRLNRS